MSQRPRKMKRHQNSSRSVFTVALLVAVASALALPGCFSKSSNSGDAVAVAFLTAAQVQDGARYVLDQRPGVKSNSVKDLTCPGNLQGKVGTTMTCTLERNGKTYDVVVTVTSVEGLRINYSVNTPSAP